MPVSAAVPLNDYTGNGSSTVYPFTFYLVLSSHLVVTVDGAVLTSGVDYTVSGLRAPGGGNVTFSTPPANGAAVRLRRVLPFSRTTDYQEAGDLLAGTLDDDVDSVVMLIQQLEYAARFYLRLPDTLSGVSPVFPAPEALKLIRWNSSGNALENTDIAGLIPGEVLVTSFAQSLLDDVSANEARATLGVTDAADTAKLTSAANVFGKTQTWARASIASAGTLTLGDGNVFDITGTTNITAIASKGAGTVVVLRFAGVLTISHGASLVLPGAAGITTQAGDVATFIEAAAGVWQCAGYLRADGTPVVNAAAPGTIIAYGGAGTPSGYLSCDGANVSRTTYAALFAAVGTTWGVGDGSTTFTLPDFRRRTLVGKGGAGTGTLGNAVGNTGGAETNSHTHTTGTASAGTVVCVGGGGNAVTPDHIHTTNAPSNTNIMQPSAVVGYFIKI